MAEEADKSAEELFDLVSMLHSFLFGVEKSKEHSEPRAFCGHIQDYMHIIEQHERSSLSGKTAEETLQKLSDFAEKVQFFDKVSFRKINEKSFEFSVERCNFAIQKKTHKRLQGGKDICPMAMIAGSLIRHAQKIEVNVHPSEFTDEDSRTIMELK